MITHRSTWKGFSTPRAHPCPATDREQAPPSARRVAQNPRHVDGSEVPFDRRLKDGNQTAQNAQRYRRSTTEPALAAATG